MRLPNAAPANGLLWFPEEGMGYYPVPDGVAVYGQAYWDKYAGYDQTELGKALTKSRVDMVARWWAGKLIDVGIGAGAFVSARNAYGWDVNPIAVRWLRDHSLLLNPEEDNGPVALTFWDCLEHIKEPDRMLSRAQWVFVSLPLFEGPDHVLGSRHFRKDEHCWYWTRSGFLKWMGNRGFTCREHNTMESLLGREDIHSFAFER